jgi:hypothetical protein
MCFASFAFLALSMNLVVQTTDTPEPAWTAAELVV